MTRIKQFVHWAWTQISIRRYLNRRAAAARLDRDVAERQVQAADGIKPYGRPGATL